MGGFFVNRGKNRPPTKISYDATEKSIDPRCALASLNPHVILSFHPLLQFPLSQDFKRGVKPPFRSSSLTDLRNLHMASSGGAAAADGEPRSSSATPPDAAAANLAVRSFHEAAF